MNQHIQVKCVASVVLQEIELACSHCGNVGNADFNTAFNIASKHISMHHRYGYDGSEH
ncbi:MAG: transposase [Methanosarcinaceae archaeon]|nr:transposase [Methanosarcinaceae archaeon]